MKYLYNLYFYASFFYTTDMDMCVNSVCFGKALPASKKADFSKTVYDAKKILGLENGLSLLKLDCSSFPQIKTKDTGIGKINSPKALNFIKFLTFYTGANAVKIFPFGQHTRTGENFYCPYNKTSLTIGEDNINLFNLLDKRKYGNILSRYDIEPFVKQNGNKHKINFENELGTSEDYCILKPLKTAFTNFKNNLSTEELKSEFEKYKMKPIVNEVYPRLALYSFLKDCEPELFKNIDKSAEKQLKYKNYQEKYKDEIEFFKFRQFLAEKDFLEAKEKINADNIKLFGDCLIGFSERELWAYPEAFAGSPGWKLPALNTKNLLNNNTAANKVFNYKLKFFLEHFDGIRFDVGWWYAIARVEENNEAYEYDFKHKVFDYIEKKAKEIKGKDFNTKNLIFEMDGFSHLFTWDKKPVTPLKNIRNIVSVLTTEYEHNNKEASTTGWGHPAFFKKYGMREDEFIIGTNNHDGENLRVLAESKTKNNRNKRKNTIPVLAKALNIPAETLKNPKEFIKAKFAELFTVRNQFLFFVDVLGSNKNIDDQTEASKNYRFRVKRNFEEQYHTALQQGKGFNIMEALGLVMHSRKLDSTNPDLYKKVMYYADYLRAPGAKSEREANIAEHCSTS